MGIIFELIFGFLVELVLTILGEAVAELGLHAISEALNAKAWKRFLVGSLYATGGLILGAISLNLFPKMVFSTKVIPAVHFIVSPVIAGLALCFVSWIINRGINDRGFFDVSKFIYGVIFALLFSLTRSIFG
jgi:hypothetical protein